MSTPSSLTAAWVNITFYKAPHSARFIYYLILLRLTMESITIKVDKAMAKELEQSMKPDYATKTEFIREAIRDKMEERRKQESLRDLAKHFGRARTRTTDAEDRMIREKVSRELLKEYGLE